MSVKPRLFDSVVSYKISDLLFAVRMEEACLRSSVAFKKAESLDEFGQIVSGKGRTLLVCDLTSVRSELEEIMRFAKEKNCKVLGFYPHVDKVTESLARALDVEYVTPRSAFQLKLKSLLS